LLDTQIQVNDTGVQLEAEIEERIKASLYQFVKAIQQNNSYHVAQSTSEPVLALLE
jgi:hypothetical protein